MATLTSFRAGGVCSVCRAYGRVWVNSHFGGRGATYVIGDDVRDDVGDDYATHSYLVKEPRPGEPARALSTWTCETCGRYSFAELVFDNGWLVDLQVVEPTVAMLDRIHYIATYDSEAIEALIGRSMWDGDRGIWPGWLAALREALARKDAATTPELHEEGEFPLGDTLDGGRFRLVEHYLGGGADQLWFARSVADRGARYLVSTTIDNGLDRETVVPALLRTAGGLFTPRFVGAFDPSGDVRVSAQDIGYVEQVPPGWPLGRTDIAAQPNAFRLGVQIAEKLLVAAADGVLPIGLRPEYIWVADRPSGPEVTGVGGRNFGFFGSARRRRDLPTVPLFTRKYVAPEAYRGEPYDDRALVLTVAVMTAEWLLGRYPYENDDAYGYLHLCDGSHVELPHAARELAPALSPDPAARPDLADFARTLERLAR